MELVILNLHFEELGWGLEVMSRSFYLFFPSYMVSLIPEI
jgi:hypothetical protein